MSEYAGYAGTAFITVGLLFDFLGCLGIIRLPEVYLRLMAATKCVTLGTSSIMFGVFLMSGFNAVGVKALLCAAFLLLTAPVSAHAIARAAHKAGVPLWDKSVCDEYTKDTKA